MLAGTYEQPASMTLSTLQINQGSNYPIIKDSSTSPHIYGTEFGPVPTSVSSGHPDVSVESATVIVTDTTTEITQK
ncbi:unnamed protein product [Clonostachys solani]|uniref:Uncharacterized protein n=1 Tax=Clonostachys solani TaxID=160281 RepID=A0A9N9ZMX9_9HYPO|nr:unnamed protein product [Clonostachys solani]